MCEPEVCPSAEVQSLTVPDGHGRSMSFSIHRPPAAAESRLPVLIVLAGVKTNERTLERAPRQKSNILITYQYDYDQARWRTSGYLYRAWHTFRVLRQISRQFVSLVRWVKAQPWVDAQRVNVAGGSLGAICLPMCLRELQREGIELRTVVFAYGGANLGRLCYLMLKPHSTVIALVGATLTASLLRWMDPARHLPHLRGDFLLVSSPEDERIPRACAERFERLTPEPKTVIHKTGEHVDSDYPEILDEVFDTTLRWLKERGALNE